MLIRRTEEKDLPALLDIYNYEILNGTATLDLNVKTMDEWQQWYLDHCEGNHIALTAELDGKAVGYATLSSYREKEAYSSTVELSVYVSPDFRNCGVATALMERIITIASQDDTVHSVVSVITAGNEASEKLHGKFGFVYCGTLHEVGFKHGRYQDIDNFELLV